MTMMTMMTNGGITMESKTNFSNLLIQKIKLLTSLNDHTQSVAVLAMELGEMFIHRKLMEIYKNVNGLPSVKQGRGYILPEEIEERGEFLAHLLLRADKLFHNASDIRGAF